MYGNVGMFTRKPYFSFLLQKYVAFIHTNKIILHLQLLGISSKRLLAVLDGVEPPSDTESSSPSPPSEQLETISLDSISSDEELLSSSNKKKKVK